MTVVERLRGRGARTPARMHNHLNLKKEAAAWRADPPAQEAMAGSRVGRLPNPTLGPGESVADLMADDLEVAATAGRGFHYDRLTFDHLLGVRG